MKKIIIATIMRKQGDTGVQTHFQCFINYLTNQQQEYQFINPFSYYSLLVYPIFAFRKILHYCSGSASLWWYRYWHRFFLQAALKKSLKNENNCVIYAQCPLSAAAALASRTSRQQKVIMVTHFNVSQADEWVGKGLISTGSKYYQSIQALESSILPQLDGIIYVSQFIKNELIQRIPNLANVPSAIIPNFLPDPGVVINPYLKADLISIGTLEARKNQRYLLEIIAALRSKGLDLSLTIVGDGPDRAMLTTTAQALNITDLVNFTGFINNAASLISHHKALILVSIIENLPISLLEAIAQGRPVFAVPSGGIPEILNNGKVGLALPLNDVDTAATLIAEAIQNQQWLDEMGQAGRSLFLEKYVSEVSAQNLVNFLQKTS